MSILSSAHNFLSGRYFGVLSNKLSKRKYCYRKGLMTSILEIQTIALLRRWLWVRAPPNPNAHVAWVYILRGSCGRYYIGSTENLDRRLAEHRRGKVHSTRRFGQPLELVDFKEMPSFASTRELERKLKAKKNPQVAVYLLSQQIN